MIVSDNVKFPRLIPELKQMVEADKISVHAALEA